MQFLCRDCGYKTVVRDRSIQLCPECNSNNIKVFLFGSKVREGGKVERKRSNCSACLGFLVGLIGVPAFFLYTSYQMYEQGRDILGWWETGGIILIAIALGIIGSVIGLIIGYFSSGSSEKSQEGREVPFKN